MSLAADTTCVQVRPATTRRCTDRVHERRAAQSLIASTSIAPVDAAISVVERTALIELVAAGYGAEDIADARLLLDCLREEMAAVFSRR